jgi:hypothetical protein
MAVFFDSKYVLRRSSGRYWAANVTQSICQSFASATARAGLCVKIRSPVCRFPE